MKDTCRNKKDKGILRELFAMPKTAQLLWQRQEKTGRPWENKQVAERDARKAATYMKRFPALLTISWMYIQTWHHLTHIRLTEIRKLGNKKSWGRWGEIRSLSGRVNYLSKDKSGGTTEKLPCTTHNPILGTYARELFVRAQEGTHKRMLIVALCMVPRSWRHPGVHHWRDWISKMQLAPTVEYQAAVQSNEAETG